MGKNFHKNKSQSTGTKARTGFSLQVMASEIDERKGAVFKLIAKSDVST